MNYLTFELDEAGEGIGALEGMASTQAAQHAAVMGEVEQVMAWAREQFPHTHGPVEDGHDWHHELRVRVEPGGWHTVTLTLSASDRFIDAFQTQFGAVGE